MKSDVYKTIDHPSEEIVFKDRNSKFFGYALPVETEDNVKAWLDQLKKQHSNARHWCYAYQLGLKEPNILYRANDDGEPNNSAGLPIYGQIQSFNLTNILIVVVRYFGGTKLGVSGLINAYKTASEMAIKNSKIVKRTIQKKFNLQFDYEVMNAVMRNIKENDIKIEENISGTQCELLISVRLTQVENFKTVFKNLYKVKIKELN